MTGLDDIIEIDSEKLWTDESDSSTRNLLSIVKFKRGSKKISKPEYTLKSKNTSKPKDTKQASKPKHTLKSKNTSKPKDTLKSKDTKQAIQKLVAKFVSEIPPNQIVGGVEEVNKFLIQNTIDKAHHKDFRTELIQVLVAQFVSEFPPNQIVGGEVVNKFLIKIDKALHEDFIMELVRGMTGQQIQCEKKGCGKWRFVTEEIHQLATTNKDVQFVCADLKTSCETQQDRRVWLKLPPKENEEFVQSSLDSTDITPEKEISDSQELLPMHSGINSDFENSESSFMNGWKVENSESSFRDGWKTVSPDESVQYPSTEYDGERVMSPTLEKIFENAEKIGDVDGMGSSNNFGYRHDNAEFFTHALEDSA